jgi:hypothetical protein
VSAAAFEAARLAEANAAAAEAGWAASWSAELRGVTRAMLRNELRRAVVAALVDGTAVYPASLPELVGLNGAGRFGLRVDEPVRLLAEVAASRMDRMPRCESFDVSVAMTSGGSASVTVAEAA